MFRFAESEPTKKMPDIQKVFLLDGCIMVIKWFFLFLKRKICAFVLITRGQRCRKREREKERRKEREERERENCIKDE